MNRIWRKICYPEGIHAWRWRALLVWVILFSCITAYAFQVQKDDAHKTQDRFCDVTSSFLSSEIQLRDQLNKGAFVEVGLRQNVEEAARNGVYVFSSPSLVTLQPPIRKSVLNFFIAIDELQQAQIVQNRSALAKTDEFVERLGKLKQRLKC